MKNITIAVGNAVILVLTWVWSFFKDVVETYVEITKYTLASVSDQVIRSMYTAPPSEDETIGVITAVAITMIIFSVVWAPLFIGISLGWNIAKYTHKVCEALFDADKTPKPVLLLN